MPRWCQTIYGFLLLTLQTLIKRIKHILRSRFRRLSRFVVNCCCLRYEVEDWYSFYFKFKSRFRLENYSRFWDMQGYLCVFYGSTTPSAVYIWFKFSKQNFTKVTEWRHLGKTRRYGPRTKWNTSGRRDAEWNVNKVIHAVCAIRDTSLRDKFRYYAHYY